MWYYGLTTLWGNQTLGEEYCNIVQVAPRQSQFGAGSQNFQTPSFRRRAAAVLVHLLGPYALEKLLAFASRRVGSRDLPVQLTGRQYRMLENALDFAEEVVSTVHLFHVALFYFRGIFYQLGKRVAGIRYLMIRYEPSNNQQQVSSVLNPYRLLGWLVAIQVAVRLAKWGWRLFKLRNNPSKETETDDGSDNGRLIFTVACDSRPTLTRRLVRIKCPLCLEECRNTSTTPCGHLFCWQCVAEWVNDRFECPVCRSPVDPQTLVALQHFSL